MLTTLLRLLAAILAFLPWLVVRGLLRLRSRRRLVATLRLHGGLRESASPARRFDPDPGRSLLELLEHLRTAGEEPSVRAVALRIGSLAAGWAQLDELREAISELRRRGRPVHAYLDRPGHAELYLAVACDHVTLAPLASVDLVGLRAEVTFYKDALAKASVEPHFLSAGDYKAYGETFTRTTMSDEAREALDFVMGGIHRGLVAAVAAGRGLTPEAVQSLVDDGPHSAQEALDAGLVDAVEYPDAWRRALRRSLGDDVPEPDEDRGAEGPRHHFVGLGKAIRLRRRERWLHSVGTGRKAVAVLALEGSIVDSDGTTEGPGRISPRPTIEALKALRTDDRVGAVVLRVNSPGGSGLASDMIWRELRRLAEKKPLVASMGSVAASGGYYLSMAAHEVLADPLTITGSIGVVAGKFDVSGLLERLGVTRDVLSYGANSGLNSPTSGLTDPERERLRQHIEEFYAAFVGKAAACRGVPYDELEPHAQGRIWTGEQAVERRLVDSLGGVRDAVRRAGVRGKLGADPEIWLVEPPRPGLLERLGSLPITGVQAMRRQVEGTLGVELDRLEDGDPVQARMPFSLLIR